MNAVAAPEKKPKRKRSGTAKWHMSREAVSMPLDELYKMDEPACWKFFVESSLRQQRYGPMPVLRIYRQTLLSRT